MSFRLFLFWFCLLVPSKWLAGEIVSKMTCNVSSGMVNRTLSISILQLVQAGSVGAANVEYHQDLKRNQIYGVTQWSAECVALWTFARFCRQWKSKLFRANCTNTSLSAVFCSEPRLMSVVFVGKFSRYVSEIPTHLSVLFMLLTFESFRPET